MNILYGAVGSAYFRMYNTNSAMAITLTGQAAIQRLEIAFNDRLGEITGEYKDNVIAVDTDSNYVDLTDTVEKLGITGTESEMVESIHQFIESDLAKVAIISNDTFGEQMNCYTQTLYAKREKIMRGLFVRKKRYVAKVFDNEGVRYSSPDYSVTGLESVRSSTPEWCRSKLEECYRYVFDNTQSQLVKKVSELREQYDRTPFVQIANATSASRFDHYIVNGECIKGTPAQVKAAKAFNDIVTKLHLHDKYPLIKSGDKVRLLKLMMPNPYNVEVIAFQDDLPQEFGLHKFIDRERMFDETFRKPLQSVVGVRGWSTEKQFSLW